MQTIWTASTLSGDRSKCASVIVWPTVEKSRSDCRASSDIHHATGGFWHNQEFSSLQLAECEGILISTCVDVNVSFVLVQLLVTWQFNLFNDRVLILGSSGIRPVAQCREWKEWKPWTTYSTCMYFSLNGSRRSQTLFYVTHAANHFSECRLHSDSFFPTRTEMLIKVPTEVAD